MNRKFVAPITGVLSAVIVALLPKVGIEVTPDLQQSIMLLIGLFVALIVGGDVGYDYLNVLNPQDIVTPPITPLPETRLPAPPDSHLFGPTPTLASELDRLKNEAGTPSIIVQPLDKAINPNSDLKAFTATEWAGGRAKDVPDTFKLAWQPFKLDDPYAPPPELHTKENGLRVEVSHRRGRLLLSQNLPMIIPAQRYLLKVTVACDLKLKPDMPAITGAIAVHGQLLSDGAVLKRLDAWSPQNAEDATGEFEALWVFEFGRKLPNIEYLVEVRIGTLDSVPFDDLSHITLQGIEVIPVAGNFGGTEVYRV